MKRYNDMLQVEEVYGAIEHDIISNQEDIFNMYNHYTTKHRGTRLMDINVGLFLNDRQVPTVQIFVRKKNEYIRTQLFFNRTMNKLEDIKTLNYKINA